MWNDVVKQILHYTLLDKTGHLKVDTDLRRRGGQQGGQARKESITLTWKRQRMRTAVWMIIKGQRR